MVKWFEKAPVWLKVVFALPVLDIIWGIFRIVKGVTKSKPILIVIGIIWVILGGPIFWLIDIISILIKKHPVLA